MAQRTAWRICRTNQWWSVFGTPGCGKHKRPGPPVHDDLVERQFAAQEPNQVCFTNISVHTTREGKIYLCAVKDVFSGRIVGSCIDARMKAPLAVTALKDAVARGRLEGQSVAGCVLHSGRGSHFRSRKLQHALNRHAIVGSMGRVSAARGQQALHR